MSETTDNILWEVEGSVPSAHFTTGICVCPGRLCIISPLGSACSFLFDILCPLRPLAGTPAKQFLLLPCQGLCASHVSTLKSTRGTMKLVGDIHAHNGVNQTVWICENTNTVCSPPLRTVQLRWRARLVLGTYIEFIIQAGGKGVYSRLCFFKIVI